jgi:hypothetical protein
MAGHGSGPWAWRAGCSWDLRRRVPSAPRGTTREFGVCRTHARHQSLGSFVLDERGGPIQTRGRDTCTLVEDTDDTGHSTRDETALGATYGGSGGRGQARMGAPWSGLAGRTTRVWRHCALSTRLRCVARPVHVPRAWPRAMCTHCVRTTHSGTGRWSGRRAAIRVVHANHTPPRSSTQTRCTVYLINILYSPRYMYAKREKSRRTQRKLPISKKYALYTPSKDETRRHDDESRRPSSSMIPKRETHD